MNKFLTTFPQELWKSLWKTHFLALQVPEKFRLIAFCTLSRHISQTHFRRPSGHLNRRAGSHFRPSPRALLRACAITATLHAACVKLPRQEAPPALANVSPRTASGAAPDSPRIDINHAPATELERLPGVGRVLAARIVAHRERHGPFRRPADLIIVRGFSERHFRELSPLITVGDDKEVTSDK